MNFENSAPENFEKKGTGAIATFLGRKAPSHTNVEYPDNETYYGCVDIHTYDIGGRFGEKEIAARTWNDILYYFNRNCPLHKNHIEA